VGMAVKKELLAPMQQWLAAYDVAQVSTWCGRCTDGCSCRFELKRL
jgi:hypothetical protein